MRLGGRSRRILALGSRQRARHSSTSCVEPSSTAKRARHSNASPEAPPLSDKYSPRSRPSALERARRSVQSSTLALTPALDRSYVSSAAAEGARSERARQEPHERPVHSSSPRSCTTERGTGRQPLRMPRLRSAYERSCWHSHDDPALSTALILALYRVHRSARDQPPPLERVIDRVRRASNSREVSSVPRSRSE